jgi:hypothetical protein
MFGECLGVAFMSRMDFVFVTIISSDCLANSGTYVFDGQVPMIFISRDSKNDDLSLCIIHIATSWKVWSPFSNETALWDYRGTEE